MVAAHAVSTSSTHQRRIAATPKKRPAPTTAASVAAAKMEQGNAFVRANKRSKGAAAGGAGVNGKAAASTPGKAAAAVATIPGAGGAGGAGSASTGGAAYTRGMFLAFVDNALQERRMGRSDAYNELVSQFKALSSPATSASSAAGQGTPSLATLKSWIEALTHVVAQLDRSHLSLVDAIIALPWTTIQDEAFVHSYCKFVQALLCTRSEFVQMTLERIVKGFRFQFTNTYTHAESSSPSEMTRRQTYDRLHRLLGSLLHLIPTLPSTLWQLVNRYFPHKRESRNAQVVYMANALQLVQYCPQLGENVLTAVIQRAIQIDVEIQCDIEDFEDDEGVLDEEVFGFSIENPFDKLVSEEDNESDSDSEDGDAAELDLGDISSGDESSDDDEEEPSLDADDADDEEARKAKVLSPKVIKNLKEMAAKLDAILKVILDFLQRLNESSSASFTTRNPASAFSTRTPTKAALSRTSTGSSFDSAAPFPAVSGNPALATGIGAVSADAAIQASIAQHNSAFLRRTIFDVLLAIFDDKILRTFRTRHTQFILFWYSSLSPEFTDHFSGALIGRALDEQSTPTITRVAAAGYVASFVSRSTGIDRTAARRVMGLLCTYMEDVMDDLRIAHASIVVGNIDADRIVRSSVVFYAICQAALYIFCFRWKDFLEEAAEGEDDDLLGDEMEGVAAPKRRWMADLEVIKQAVSSGLNPLKMCSPTVVSQFARMAHRTNFLYCHSIIEANKRQSRRSTLMDSPSNAGTPTVEYPSVPLPPPHAQPHPALSRSSSMSLVAAPNELNLVQKTLKDAQIDSHFPFDPYKLPLSAGFVQGIYREWDSGGLDDDDEDEDDDDEEDADTEVEMSHDEGLSAQEGSSVDSTASGFLLPPRPGYGAPGGAHGLPRGAMSFKGVRAAGDEEYDHDGESGSQDETDVFSKSFDAMSVSPRRNPGILAGL